MSYNKDNYATSAHDPAAYIGITPGTLEPRELINLGLNNRVFRGFKYQGKAECGISAMPNLISPYLF